MLVGVRIALVVGLLTWDVDRLHPVRTVAGHGTPGFRVAPQPVLRVLAGPGDSIAPDRRSCDPTWKAREPAYSSIRPPGDVATALNEQTTLNILRVRIATVTATGWTLLCFEKVTQADLSRALDVFATYGIRREPARSAGTWFAYREPGAGTLDVVITAEPPLRVGTSANGTLLGVVEVGVR